MHHSCRYALRCGSRPAGAVQGFHVMVDDLGPFGEVARAALAAVAEEHGRVPRLLFALRDRPGRPSPLPDVRLTFIVHGLGCLLNAARRSCNTSITFVPVRARIWACIAAAMLYRQSPLPLRCGQCTAFEGLQIGQEWPLSMCACRCCNGARSHLQRDRISSCPCSRAHHPNPRQSSISTRD